MAVFTEPPLEPHSYLKDEKSEGSETQKPGLFVTTGVSLEGLTPARHLTLIISLKSPKGSTRQEMSFYRQENLGKGKFPISGEKR